MRLILVVFCACVSLSYTCTVSCRNENPQNQCSNNQTCTLKTEITNSEFPNLNSTHVKRKCKSTPYNKLEFTYYSPDHNSYINRLTRIFLAEGCTSNWVFFNGTPSFISTLEAKGYTFSDSLRKHWIRCRNGLNLCEEYLVKVNSTARISKARYEVRCTEKCRYRQSEAFKNEAKFNDHFLTYALKHNLVHQSVATTQNSVQSTSPIVISKSTSLPTTRPNTPATTSSGKATTARNFPTSTTGKTTSTRITPTSTTGKTTSTRVPPTSIAGKTTTSTSETTVTTKATTSTVPASTFIAIVASATASTSTAYSFTTASRPKHRSSISITLLFVIGGIFLYIVGMLIVGLVILIIKRHRKNKNSSGSYTDASNTKTDNKKKGNKKKTNTDKDSRSETEKSNKISLDGAWTEPSSLETMKSAGVLPQDITTSTSSHNDIKK